MTNSVKETNSPYADFQTDKLGKKLNQLLANYQVFYQSLRGFHWNIKGEDFFELHSIYEDYYMDIIEKMDKIAKHVLTIKTEPFHTFLDYLKHFNIHEENGVANDIRGLEIIVKNFPTIISLEKEILNLVGEAKYKGTVGLMNEYISDIEKILLFLKRLYFFNVHLIIR